MRVSICLATFNGVNFLPETFLRITSQLSEGDEIVVVDDASTDGTWEWLKRRESGQVSLLQNERNRGSSYSFFRAIQNARNELILLSDQDDIWREDKVDSIRRCFEASGCDLLVHDADISQAGVMLPYSLFEKLKSGPGFLKNLLRNTFSGCCMAFRASLVPELLAEDRVGLNVHHDQYIGLMATVFRKKIHFAPERLITWVRHDRNSSTWARRRDFLLSVQERWVLLLAILRNYSRRTFSER
jgi:glycosyltransferase involved in cell wall biosynthesis